MIEKIAPYLLSFGLALLFTLALTPVVREFNRRLGMVDKPDSRRINKVPIPRGGGLGLFLGVNLALLVSYFLIGDVVLGTNIKDGPILIGLAIGLVALGYADDKYSLNPKVKLFGQLLVAAATWYFTRLGFQDVWPSMPTWVDAALTVFWITGAINAFNLIDGLDGLASGLALIATLGMTGALFFTGHASMTYFYFAFMGGLLGFLRYNYNPASVFLGDSGSMYIGYVIAVMALASHTSDSMLISVVVPLLAMGVPIFDTSLAIIRRSIRHLLRKDGSDVGNDKVMTADTDHLHHRILRAVGLNQKKAAWTLYLMASALVIVGLVGVSLKSRAAGLWLAAVAAAATIVFRDMSRIELFDAGRLLNRVAHSTNIQSRRRMAKLRVPFYLTCDVLLLVVAYLLCCWVLKIPLTSARLRAALPIQVVSTFGCLVFFRAYVTIWSRAMTSNYARLLLACVLGSIIGSVARYYIPSVPASQLRAMTILYSILPFFLLLFLRFVRPTIRDLFYALDCRQLIERKDVTRILVYGTGLRYRAFRRELVRKTSANDRIIIGLIDDDILLRDHYIGGVQVKGSLHEAPQVIKTHKVDAVVIAFDVSPEKERIICEILKPTGVKITKFAFSESEVGA